MEKNIKAVLNWINKNRFLSLIIIIALIVAGFFSSVFFGSFSPAMSKSMAESGSYAEDFDMSRTMVESVSNDYETALQKYEYQIKEGTTSIETKSIDSDYQKIKENAEGYGGWVETINKNEDYSQLTMSATFKIPAESFDSYVEWLLQNFDVKSSNLNLYRVSVRNQQDEIDILTKTLDAYDRLLQKAESMELDAKTLQVMQQITQNKLYLMSQLKSYGYSVEQIEERSGYATISVTLTQKKDIEIMPEDLGRDLMTKLRSAVRSITNALLDLVTVPVVIFITLLIWIIYALVILIPLFVVYKFVMRLFKWLNNKIK